MKYHGATTGRVVRVHLSCRAELPLGSSLRVTGSTLWALTHEDALMGGNNAASSSNDAATRTEFGPSGHHPSMIDDDSTLLSSTVEMVTSPDTYPIWRTRQPVIVVVHDRSHKHPDATLQHHRYRYLVVTPGADILSLHQQDNNQDEDVDETVEQLIPISAEDDEIAPPSSTATPITTPHSVVAWENPFADEPKHALNGENTMTNSVASFVTDPHAPEGGRGPAMNRVLMANLPYRTLDINVATASPLPSSKSAPSSLDNTDPSFSIIDNWNNGEDETFSSYLDREAIHKKIRMMKTGGSSFGTDISEASEHNMVQVTSDNDGMNKGGSESGSPPQERKQRIFFVCFHLPVIVTKDERTGQWSACWAESLLAKTKGSKVVRMHDAHWIGTVTTEPPITRHKDREAVRALLSAMDCTALFLEPHVLEAHYLGMCKQVLWPAFHNIDLLDLSTSGWMNDHSNNNDSSNQQTQEKQGESGGPTVASNGIFDSDWDQSRLDGWWDAYCTVNKAFADVLNGVLEAGDIMWVHDYHLSMLPKLVDEKEIAEFGQSTTKKVFFLHIPFPTSQIFRELECGEAILEGILHADVVGFHAFDHARHFLNAAKRILGLNYESMVGGLIGVQFGRKTVVVTMNNVSIESHIVEAALQLPSVQADSASIRKKYPNRATICGLDVAQRLSGVSFKLLAYERLLVDYPMYQKRVVMIQKCLVPGSRKSDEANTLREVRYLVQRIQNKFGPDVLDYEEIRGSSLPIDKRLILWRASDVFMSSTLREGLNLSPLEYIFAKQAPEMPGVVISSEFSAVCSILNGALRLNPFDIKASAICIDKALTMDVQEKEGRRTRDMDFVSTCPSSTWTKNVLRDLRDSTLGASDHDISSVIFSPHGKPQREEEIDTTASFLAREHEVAFTHLDSDSVLRAYNVTSRRVIILDFNGTIVIKEPPGKYLKREILGTSGNKPPGEVLKALKALSEDKQNIVYVVSGDAQENVVGAVGNIPGLGLAASNGACFSPPLLPGESQRKWQTLDLGVDWKAIKRVALPVLSKYTARTNGSFVKLTHSSIGWSYYSCDPEWGAMQATHLLMELSQELSAFDVRFVTLKGVIEVLPRRLNKGLIVQKVLREASLSNGGVDFILCMGDDISDEKMFTSVFSFVSEMHPGSGGGESTQSTQPIYALTAAVGKKSSHASQYVDDARDVANLLVNLSGVVSITPHTNTAGARDEVNQRGVQFFE